MTAPRHALGPRMRGEAAVAVHDVKLAVLAAGIRLAEEADHVLRRDALAQEREATAAMEGVRQGLACHRARPDLDRRHTRPDGKELRRDRDAHGAAGLIPRDDRPGHRLLPCLAGRARMASPKCRPPFAAGKRFVWARG